MGIVFTDVEANDAKRPQERPDGAAREDIVDLRHRRTQGQLRGAEGIFPNGFPHNVEEFGHSHNLSGYTHRMQGIIGSRGTTEDRDRPGGVPYGISWVSTAGSTSTGTGTCAKDALQR